MMSPGARRNAAGLAFAIGLSLVGFQPALAQSQGRRIVRKAWWLAAMALSTALVLPALAQQPSARPFESLPPPASQSVSDAETEDELGELVLLQGPGRQKLFEVSNDTKYMYTSNVLLLPDAGIFNSTQDFLTLETLGLDFTPQLADDLFSTFYVRHQWAFYSAHSENNFDAQSIGLQLAHPVKDWFNVYGGFSANRAYLTRVDGNEFFRMYDAQIGIWHEQTTRSAKDCSPFRAARTCSGAPG